MQNMPLFFPCVVKQINRNILRHGNSIAICVQNDSKSKYCLVCRPIFIPVQNVCLDFFDYVFVRRLVDFHIFFFIWSNLWYLWKLNRTLNEKICECICARANRCRWTNSGEMVLFTFNNFFVVRNASKYGTFKKHQSQKCLFLFIKIHIIFNNLNQPNIIKIREYFSGRVHCINFGFNFQFELGIKKILVFDNNNNNEKTMRKMKKNPKHPFKLYKQWKRFTGDKIDRLKNRKSIIHIFFELTQLVVRCNVSVRIMHSA